MVKAIWNGKLVAESEHTEIVEGNHYFPTEALRNEFFYSSDTQTVCPWKGTARYYTLVVGDKENVDAAWYYPHPKPAAQKIAGKVAFWKGVRVETEAKASRWWTGATGALGGAARQASVRPTRQIRITHRRSGEVIAQGPAGLWGITSFEGNFYIRRKYLKTEGFRPNWMPGFCIYKFLYVYLDLYLPDGSKEPFLGWLYWLPNPLLPFIAFRPAVSQVSSALCVEEFSG